jgi:hypothetical protein
LKASAKSSLPSRAARLTIIPVEDEGFNVT